MSKGIWIDQELIDLDITWLKKALLSEVSQLEILDKGCIASNKHFSEKFNITTQGVSKALNELFKDGYIVIDNAQTKRNFGRTITINHRKSAINHRKSAINHSLESKEKKPEKNTFKIHEGVSKKAFEMWCKYKGKKYSKQGMTLSANKLAEYPHDIQIKMVENSIMNNYAGLFEIKQQKTSANNQTQIGSVRWQMEQEAKQHVEVIDV